jgi:hypothetical protein
MRRKYTDITSRITENPLWWDFYGVPRYEPFTYQMSSDVYADEVLLLKIACQACATEFNVEVSRCKYEKLPKLADNIKDVFYGDPPNTSCCQVGPTMSSISLYIIEFWERDNLKWRRRTDLENIQIESLDDYFGNDAEEFIKMLQGK